MAKSQINADISTQILRFRPGEAAAQFEVKVVNESDRFATFQLEILAAGADPNLGRDWYRLSPEVSTKKPPGDITIFRVEILDAPLPGFIGTMNLTVRIFSMEIQSEERLILRMVITESTSIVPMRLELPVREFHNCPNDLVEIPIVVFNPSQLATEVTLRCFGLEPGWLIDGNERDLLINPGSKATGTFLCQIPEPAKALSKVYNFTIEAQPLNGPASEASGFIDVLASGYMDFGCKPYQRNFPEGLNWFTRWRETSVFYDLIFDNRSNLVQEVSATAEGDDLRYVRLEFEPSQAESLPGSKTVLRMKVSPKGKKWLGFGAKRVVFVTKSATSNQQVDLRNDTQMLTLFIGTLIHPILQLLLLLLLLYLLWANSFMNPGNPRIGHQDAVNSVELNGLADRAVSASNDQTVQQWYVGGFINPLLNQSLGPVNVGDKAVRVVRYRPTNNDHVAEGLENGEIQLWDLTQPNPKLREGSWWRRLMRSLPTSYMYDSFFFNKDDRVFDLEFTRDGRTLFSAHGSGLVLHWQIARDRSDETTLKARLLRRQTLGFAVYGVALVGNREEDRYLAIAGRFNNLRLWNFLDNQLRPVSYRPGSQDDYITSAVSATERPYLLATADTQGYIGLRDMRSCLTGSGDCTLLEEWSGHSGRPVRAVALSADGCYLASVGDDGNTRLWYLTAAGKRATERLEGEQVATSLDRRKVNGVDIKVIDRQINIINAGDDTQVNFFQLPRQPKYQCDQ